MDSQQSNDCPAVAPRATVRTSWARVMICSVVGGAALVVATLVAVPKPSPTADDAVDQVIQLYAQGNRDAAIAACDAACGQFPAAYRPWLARGMLADDRNDLDGAEKAYVRAREVMGAHTYGVEDIEITLADIKRRRGDAPGCLAELDAIQSRGATSGRLNQARALAFVDLKRFDDALREAQSLAEKRGGGGVARQLDKQIRQAMKSQTAKGG